MRASAMRWLLWLHRWLGLVSGLLFTVVCASGFFLALHPQIESRLLAQRLQGPVPQRSAEVTAMLARQSQQTPFDRLEIPEERSAAWRLRTPQGQLHLHPGSGELLKPWLGNAYNTVKKLHRWLLLDSKVGRPITGAGALVALVMLSSGLALWLQRSSRHLWRSMRFQQGLNWKRTNFQAHLVLGFYAAVPLMIMAASGLWWSYREPYREVLFRLLEGRPAPVVVAAGKESNKEARRFDLPYLDLLQVVDRELPYPGTVRFQIPTQGESTVQVSKARRPGFWSPPSRDELLVDIETLAVVERHPFTERSRAEKVSSLMFDLHTGNLWGDLTLLVSLLAALVGTTLPLTGTVMWWNRQRGLQQARRIRQGRSVGRPSSEERPGERPSLD